MRTMIVNVSILDLINRFNRYPMIVDQKHENLPNNQEKVSDQQISNRHLTIGCLIFQNQDQIVAWNF